MPKNKYSQMGQVVIVTKQYHRVRDGAKRLWWSETLDEPRRGWVVGYRHLSEGVYRPASGGGYNPGINDYDFDPASLKVTRKVSCIMIVWWPTMAPIPVPLNGIKEINPRNIQDYMVPLYCSAGFGDGKARRQMIEMQRNMCQEWDRDKKGRFSKTPTMGSK